MYRLEKSRRLGSFFFQHGRVKSFDTIRMMQGGILSLMDDVYSLGRQSKHKEILHRIDSVPLNVIIQAAIDDLETKKREADRTRLYVTDKVDESPTAFSYIFDACIQCQSSKMQRLIECIGEHQSLAHSVGSQSLFEACVVLHGYQSKSRNSMKSTLLSKLRSAKDENLEKFCEENPIGCLFVSHYTEWLLAMDSRQRISDTVEILIYKHPELDVDKYWDALVQYLHFLGNTAPKEECSLYYTAVGDITFAGFTAARMFMNDKSALRRITNKFMKRDSISNAAFSLSATSLVSGKSSPNRDPKMMRKFMDALLTTCPDNSFMSIHLRNIFFQVEVI